MTKLRFVTKKLSTLKWKGQVGATNWATYVKTSDKVHASKVKHAQRNNPNTEKSSSIATYNVQILNKTTAKITLYSMSKQGMHNN